MTPVQAEIQKYKIAQPPKIPKDPRSAVFTAQCIPKCIKQFQSRDVKFQTHGKTLCNPVIGLSLSLVHSKSSCPPTVAGIGDAHPIEPIPDVPDVALAERFLSDLLNDLITGCQFKSPSNFVPTPSAEIPGSAWPR